VSTIEQFNSAFGDRWLKLISPDSMAPPSWQAPAWGDELSNWPRRMLFFAEATRKNTTKARVRAKAEHPFRILKRVFGLTKVRYRGIWKNHQWLCAAFALVNLYLHRNRLAPQGA
jgi:hypothetical protein